MLKTNKYNKTKQIKKIIPYSLHHTHTLAPSCPSFIQKETTSDERSDERSDKRSDSGAEGVACSRSGRGAGSPQMAAGGEATVGADPPPSSTLPSDATAGRLSDCHRLRRHRLHLALLFLALLFLADALRTPVSARGRRITCLSQRALVYLLLRRLLADPPPCVVLRSRSRHRCARHKGRLALPQDAPVLRAAHTPEPHAPGGSTGWRRSAPRWFAAQAESRRSADGGGDWRFSEHQRVCGLQPWCCCKGTVVGKWRRGS